MKTPCFFVWAAGFGLFLSGFVATGQPAPGVTTSTPYARWSHGPSADPHYFPIAVWMQSPRNAARFKAAGINLYIGLWKGPTAAQLAELQQAGMPAICEQNGFGLQNRQNPLIVGWMHGDEPDNAQAAPGLGGYGPPILPSTIVAEYARIRAADPTRPVMLNLGQGVAWDDYIGRGVRRNHPEDYAQYLKGCDIASFDIYPMAHDSPAVAGKLEFVPRGVERLREWARPEKVVWNCIECTHIGDAGRKATPAQVRSEVWMSLIHGSRGLIYFVHQFQPRFVEAAILEDPEMLAAVTKINSQIRELAPALNSPSLTEGVQLTASNSSTTGSGKPQIDWMQKRQGGTVYLFTVNMRNQPARAEISLAGQVSAVAADVLGEGRKLSLSNGAFTDQYGPYEAHLYQIGARTP